MSHTLTPGYTDGVIVEANPYGMPAFYMIRGYMHPENLLIVQPYRYPSCHRNPPAPVQFHPCLGLTAPTIARGTVLRVVSPERALKTLPEKVRTKVWELVEYLNLEWAGVTGSYSVGCEGPSSDIDILGLYKPGVMKVLEDLASEGLIAQCKQRDILEKRAEGPGGLALDESRIKSSLVDSCYKGQPYTLRLVTSLWDKPCDRILIPYGWVEYRGFMKSVGEPVTIPTRYVLETGRGVVVVETWRTRYQEIREGYYRVRGLLRLDASSGELLVWPDMGGWIERGEPALLTSSD